MTQDREKALPASEPACQHPMNVRCVLCDPIGVAQSGKSHAPKHAIVEPASEPAPASAPYRFERWKDGQLMAEGIVIEQAGSLEQAIQKALRLCPEPKARTVLVHQPAPASAPSCCGVDRFFCRTPCEHCKHSGCDAFDEYERKAALRARAQPCQCGELRDFAAWVDTWVSNQAGAYSVHALDGLFGMARDKIAALAATAPRSGESHE